MPEKVIYWIIHKYNLEILVFYLSILRYSLRLLYNISGGNEMTLQHLLYY